MIMAHHDYVQELARLIVEQRCSVGEAAKHFGVSRRTIERWRKTPEYVAAERELRAQRRMKSFDLVDSYAEIAIETLRRIAESGRSEIARVNAARTLGEWAGLNAERTLPDAEDDLGEALTIIQRRLAEPQVAVLPPPQPGGLLPPSFAVRQHAPVGFEQNNDCLAVDALVVDQEIEPAAE